MDNYVTFRLQFESNGETELKKLSVNTDDFREVVKITTEEVKHFDEAVVNWAQAGQAVEQLQDCLGSLYGVMEELSSAWEAQSTAETKLANNMRNTMAATEEDIEAIKRLTAAQQELGVVGRADSRFWFSPSTWLTGLIPSAGVFFCFCFTIIHGLLRLRLFIFYKYYLSNV